MSNAHRDDGDAAILSARIARIQQLNRDFLELLISERDYVVWSGSREPTLRLALLDALGALDADALTRVAAVPYTLFSLGFEDHPFWEAVSAHRSLRAPQRYSGDGGACWRSSFAEVALFLAWSWSEADPLAARILFGMGDAVSEMVAAVPLWQLRRLAIDSDDLLMPRWPEHPCFWDDLIAQAARGEGPALAAARLLGTQLIAAELQRAALCPCDAGASAAGRRPGSWRWRRSIRAPAESRE